MRRKLNNQSQSLNQVKIESNLNKKAIKEIYADVPKRKNPYEHVQPKVF